MKKNVLLIVLGILGSQHLLAQDACHTFEGYTVSSNETAHTFHLFGDGNPGFLEDWYVTSGTPSIYPSGQLTGVDAFEGNQYAIAGVCDLSGDYSEGLSVLHNFQQGRSYTISLAIRNAPVPPSQPTPIDLNFILLQDTVPFNYVTNTGCTATPAVPSGADTVYTINSFDANAWQVVTFDVMNVPQDFVALWFRSNRSQGAPQVTTLLLLDSVCITEILPADCYTFEEYTVITNETAHTFDLFGNGNPGFLQDWYVTSGTPSIYPSGQLSGVDAFEGNQYAIAGVCDLGGDYSEGFSLAYDFQQGSNYTVSMAIRNAPIPSNQPTPIDVSFILLQDTIPFNYVTNIGCTATPAIPGGALTVHTIPSFATNAWQVIQFDIVNLQQDYAHLWFRNVRSQGSPQVTTLFLMDSLCIRQTFVTSISTAKEATALKCYPNPTTGLVTVETGEISGAVQLDVMNLIGQTVHSRSLNVTPHARIPLDLQHLIDGHYLIRVTSAEQQLLSRLILQR